MGIIIRQTYRNTVITYFGVLLGAINTVYLYPLFLKDTYYGLTMFLISSANLLMPLLIMGVQNSFIKFYGTFSDKENQSRFTFLMFAIPFLASLLVGLFFYGGYKSISDYVSNENNPIIKKYVWLIFIIAFCFAYFEVFYAWARTHMRSVYGNFLKEVFHRLLTLVLLLIVSFGQMSPETFIWLLLGVYVLRTFLMMINAIKVKRPLLRFKLPVGLVKIFRYNIVMLMLGLFTLMQLSIDNFFIGKLLSLEEVAYYALACFVSGTIAIPNKSMSLITNTITAKFLNERKDLELKKLYKKTSINLFVVSGFIFLIITLNLKQFYSLMPSEYAKNIGVVLILSCARLLESVMGNNNSIVFNSDYFRFMFRLLLFMSILMIPGVYFSVLYLGVYGAAVSIMLSYVVYHLIKLWMVYYYFKIHPFSKSTFKVLLTLIGFWSLFFFWDFSFHPMWSMMIKSGIITLLFLICVYKFNLSKDIKNLINSKWAIITK